MSGRDDNPIATDGYVRIKGSISPIQDDLDLAIDETDIATKLGVDPDRIAVASGYPLFGFYQNPLTRPFRRFKEGWVFAAILF